MTLTTNKPPAAASSRDVIESPMTEVAAAPREAPERREANPAPIAAAGIGSAVALSMILAAVLVLGFFAYLAAFSQVSESRAQSQLGVTFRHELAQAIAPVGPTTEGTPVAILRIPELSSSDLVVVEGTTSRDLMAGPGHLPATVLPGQPGVSTIFGRRSTFGGPFGSLLKLQVGDVVTAITGQGVNRYRVSSFGDTSHPAPANSSNRLLLVTAAPGFAPGSSVVVSADLVSNAQSVPGGLPGVAREQLPLARDVSQSLIPLAGWSQLLLLCALAATVIWVRGPKRARWPAVLCLTPIVFAVLWNVYENTAGLLPNLL